MDDSQHFYPELHAAPILVEGKRPHWNDFQPAVFDLVTSTWIAWVLENPDIDNETGTQWRSILSKDLVSWKVGNVTLPKNTTPYGDVWTGQCFIDTDNVFGFGSGSWCYFVTMPCPDAQGNQNQSVVLWTANSFQDTPVCRGIVLPNPSGNNSHFRDPSVRMFNGYPEMTITTSNGIAIYRYENNKWIKLQDILAPYNTVECAQRFTIWSEDFNQNLEIVVFSGNIFDRFKNQNTTVSMFSILTPCAGGYCMTSMASDVRRMVINSGTDFYSFRLFSGLADPCGFRKTKIYGMAWLGNWDYDTGLPLEDWVGQLSLCCEVTLRASEAGYPVLALNPLVPKWKRTFTSSNVDWSGDYSNIPLKQIPDVCEINFTVVPKDNKAFPPKFSATIYSGGYAGAILTIDQTQSPPVAIATRDNYGLRPFGDLTSWNYHPAKPISPNMTEYRIRVIKDKSSITWIINEQWSFTQIVLFPVGSQTFYIDIPHGYEAKGTCTVSLNNFPSKNISAVSNLDGDGRYLPIDTPVITTYAANPGDGTHNHAIKQLTWITNSDGSPNGLYGVIDTYGSGAVSMEPSANRLWDDYNKFKPVVVTSPLSDNTNTQVKQIFCDPKTGYYTYTLGSFGSAGITTEPRLDDFKKNEAVTSFGDTADDSSGNHRITQITYNEKAGYQSIIPDMDSFKDKLDPDDIINNDTNSSNSGNHS